MDFSQLKDLINTIKNKTFDSATFGCRVNSAETHQLLQILIENGFTKFDIKLQEFPGIIIINTCTITKKGDIESLSKIRTLNRKYPKSIILATGCADTSKLNSDKILSINNKDKESILVDINSSYTHQIKDKFSNTNRFLLKVQSGCTQFCSYCIVPFKRNYLWSLPIKTAVQTVNKAIENDYKEIIITGVNLEQYEFGFSKLVDKLLSDTKIELISFGSIPINCIDDKFIELLKNPRISNFLHIPIQSGSDDILKLMNRPYDSKKILETFNRIKNIDLTSSLLQGRMSERQVGFETEGNSGRFEFGTDIIIGFPTESDFDFDQTIKICQEIKFSKIHTFKFSSRFGTKAHILYEKNLKINKKELDSRSKQIRDLIK